MLLYCQCQTRRLNLSEFDDISSIPPIIECSENCKCDEEKCANRLVQLGSRDDLEIFDCDEKSKGKGVNARWRIERGAFVAEYLGEIIGAEEAEKLIEARSNEPNYIMYLREFFPSSSQFNSTIIDARNYSGIARFINHSCDPNLFVLPVRVSNPVPHAALFALRDIEPGEELSYDYNAGNRTATEEGKTPCFCGTSKCRGFLPNNF